MQPAARSVGMFREIERIEFGERAVLLRRRRNVAHAFLPSFFSAHIVLRHASFEKARGRGKAAMRNRHWQGGRRFALTALPPHNTHSAVFTDPLFLVVAFLAVLLVGLAKGGFS